MDMNALPKILEDMILGLDFR